MSYTIITPKSVQKQLDGLPNDVYERIVVRIQQLAIDILNFAHPPTQSNNKY